MVTCETVTVRVTAPDGSPFPEVTMPAFTRQPEELLEMVNVHYLNYAHAADLRRQPVSLADFTIYLMVQSSMEPKEQS